MYSQWCVLSQQEQHPKPIDPQGCPPLLPCRRSKDNHNSLASQAIKCYHRYSSNPSVSVMSCISIPASRLVMFSSKMCSFNQQITNVRVQTVTLLMEYPQGLPPMHSRNTSQLWAKEPEKLQSDMNNSPRHHVQYIYNMMY